MTNAERGQVNTSAAEIYEAFFLPALFAQWAPKLADAVELAPGQQVLDVACGTGVLAREAQSRVQPGGRVVGVDINPGMLAVAERSGAAVEWRHGSAEALPLPAGQFDRVLCQFGMMFFEDRPAAVREMLRVLKPGGRVAVAVWSALSDTPGYAAMTDLLQRLFGDAAADALRAPFNMGDPQRLRALFAEAGAVDPRVSTLPGMARFASLDDWVHTDVKGWTLADQIDDAQYGQLREAASGALASFVAADGTVAFAAPAHVLTATRR